MEAYKSICPDCGQTYFWNGYKTGLGKSPEQLKRMEEQWTVCRHCGSKNLKTDLDHESETGQAMDEAIHQLLGLL